MSTFNFDTTCGEVAEAFASRIQNRTFLITGTSQGGLGSELAIELAKHAPRRIILVSRSEAKTTPVIEKIKSIDQNIAVKFFQCELSDVSSVRKATLAINEDASITEIDVLINNAGMMAIKDYTTDKQGYEMQLSSNHLGHFLLTNLVLPKIIAAGSGARIVNVSSDGYRLSYFHFDDWNFSNGKTYNDLVAYGQSKTANILFTVALAQRFADKGIAVGVFAPHPGAIYSTNLTSHMEEVSMEHLKHVARETNGSDTFVPEPAPKSVEQGAAPLLAAALDPNFEQSSGSYVKDCQIIDTLDYAKDPQKAEKLWKLSEELVGQTFLS
ncbi:WW domain-containing oxidoreductase [Paramyrothecium foliicola]|nr:WW domain-containing oxidoreductase [Paramyrothecium foliicola]